MSVVVSPAHHFLAGGPEQDGVLKLGRVAALSVAQRRVGVHDAQVAQALQRYQVLALAQTVQPAAAECQCAKVLVDHVEEVLGSWHPAGHECWISSVVKYTSVLNPLGRIMSDLIFITSNSVVSLFQIKLYLSIFIYIITRKDFVITIRLSLLKGNDMVITRSKQY